MLNNITIGQYFPGDSVLHRLDPRSKIAILFFLIVAIFVFDQPTAYGVLTFLTLACMVASGVPMKTQVGSLKPLWWIILFTFLIHLFSGAGDELFHVWILTATWDGFVHGFFICLRLALLLLLSSLLTFTTSPLKLTDALEAILSPLKVVGVPAHELAMMMTIALRFVPTLIEETDKIMKAQQSRGADFLTGTILHRLKNVVPILVPLFISAFRRADDLAMAMEARCYRGGIGRTQMKELRFAALDYVAWAVTAVLLAALGALAFAMPGGVI